MIKLSNSSSSSSSSSSRSRKRSKSNRQMISIKNFTQIMIINKFWQTWKYKISILLLSKAALTIMLKSRGINNLQEKRYLRKFYNKSKRNIKRTKISPVHQQLQQMNHLRYKHFRFRVINVMKTFQSGSDKSSFHCHLNLSLRYVHTLNTFNTFRKRLNLPRCKNISERALIE